jgi:DNA-directed RNA polymerase specialized sigma24 family protein
MQQNEKRAVILSVLKNKKIPKNLTVDDVVHEVMVSYFLNPGKDSLAESTKLYNHTKWTLSSLWQRPKVKCEKLPDDLPEEPPPENELFDSQCLTSREKMVLSLRHKDEMTLGEIGDSLNPPVTKSRVEQILKKAYGKLKRETANIPQYYYYQR